MNLICFLCICFDFCLFYLLDWEFFFNKDKHFPTNHFVLQNVVWVCITTFKYTESSFLIAFMWFFCSALYLLFIQNGKSFTKSQLTNISEKFVYKMALARVVRILIVKESTGTISFSYHFFTYINGAHIRKIFFCKSK